MDAVSLVRQPHVLRLQLEPDGGLPHICDAGEQRVDARQHISAS